MSSVRTAADRRFARGRRMSSVVYVVAIALTIAFTTGSSGSEGGKLDRDERLAAAEAAGATTWRRVWFRTDLTTKLKPFTANGDLVLWDDAVELLHESKGWRVPFERIAAIEQGRLKGDVDTEWILFVLEDDPLGPNVAVRDGSRFGFGRRTAEIAGQLRTTLRGAGAAQWSVAADRQFVEGLEHQIRFTAPREWNVTPGETVYRDGVNRSGVATLDTGTGTTVRFVREEADGRDRCTGLSHKTVERLRAEIATDPSGRGESARSEAPATTEVSVGGCQGVRIDLAARERFARAYAVAHRGTLFTFLAAGTPDVPDDVRPQLDDIVESIAFPLLDRYDVD